MLRKLRIMGVLAAVVAMSAVSTSAAQAQFTSAAYPTTITATSNGDVFDLLGSAFKCTNILFKGTLSGASTTLTLTPHYLNCTIFALPVTVDFTSCYYVLHSGAPRTLGVSCSKAGDVIDITFYTNSTHVSGVCKAQIPEQSGKSGYFLTTEAGKAKMIGNFENLTVTMSHRTSAICPQLGTDNAAKYTIQPGGITFSGSNGAISVD